MIAPFGDTGAVTRELRALILPGSVARSARWTGAGVLRRVGRFPGRPAET